MAVYTHNLEFGIHFPIRFFLSKDFKCFQRLPSPTNSYASPQPNCLPLDYPVLGFPGNFESIPTTTLAKKNGSYRQRRWWSLTIADKKLIVHPKVSGLKGWQDAFFWLRVPEDFPVCCQFSYPRPHMEYLPSVSLTMEELMASDYFDIEDFQYTFDDGRVTVVKESKQWLPHTK